jgi:hypothetical protein
MRKPFEEAPETAMRLYKSQDLGQGRLDIDANLIVDFSIVQQESVTSWCMFLLVVACLLHAPNSGFGRRVSAIVAEHIQGDGNLGRR